MYQIMQESQLPGQLKPTNQDGKSVSQSPSIQASQPKASSRNQKSLFTKPSASGISSRTQNSSAGQSQSYSKQRPPICHSNPQHQRNLKPGYQRSLSSSVKITRKPEIDYSPFRQDGRRSFSSGSPRSNWDERFNALSQSLKDICGSPKTPSMFTRSVTVSGEVSKTRRNQNPHCMDSLSVPTCPQFQNPVRPKRSSDPHLRPRAIAREARGSVDGGRSLLSRSNPLATSTPKHTRGTKNGVSFASTQPVIIKESDFLLQLTEDLNQMGSNLQSSDVPELSAADSIMTLSCPDGLPCDQEGQINPYKVEETPPSQGHQKVVLQHVSNLPPISPKYSFSLPGSNFSSPGNTLLKSCGTTRPRSCMRRINSVFLETGQQTVFIVDPSFKKITVRHEESSKSLELELTRVLFSHLHQNSPSCSRKGESSDETSPEMGSLSYPIRTEFCYKVAIKPHMMILEELFVQLVGERTLRVGKLEKMSHGGLEKMENVEADSGSISSVILDEISLPNEVMNWTCSLTEDRRWLTIREVFHSHPVEVTQTVSLSSSQSSIPLDPLSAKSVHLDSRSSSVPVAEYSASCSARYLPIVVCHRNSSRLSIVTRVPEEFESEDLAIKRLDQQVIIKGRKKWPQNGSSLLLSAHYSTQANNALSTDYNNADARNCSPVQAEASSTADVTSAQASSAPEVLTTEEKKENRGTNPLEDAPPGGIQDHLTRSLSAQMGESTPYFCVTVSLPTEALGRTLGAYFSPLKNLVIYAALSPSKRRRLSF